MKEQLIPTPGRILVQEDSFKYEGKIMIPEKAMRRPTTGKIVKVGTDVTGFAEGQHVLYAQFSGTGIKIANQPEYRVLSPDEILLIIEGEPTIEEVSA